MKTTTRPPGQYPLKISWRTFAYKNRKLYMTKEGIFFSLIILGVGMASINTGINLLYLIFAMTCSFMVLAGVLSEYCIQKISCGLSCPHEVFAGENFPVTVKLHNDKKQFPSFSLRLSLEIADIAKNDEIYLHRVPAKGSVKKTILMKIEKRGRFSLEAPELSTRFPFNFGVKSRLLDPEASFIVFPELLQEGKVHELLTTAFGGERNKQQLSEQGEFAGSRQFQSGDNIKFINWKASAKGDTIYVKEFEINKAKKVCIFLDNSQNCLSKTFEEKVSLAASLIYYASDWGYKIHFATPDSDFPAIDSEIKEHKALAYLAEITQIPPQKSFKSPFPSNETYIEL